ncbi:MAG: XdhC family protein [Pseudomonadales bacterium]
MRAVDQEVLGQLHRWLQAGKRCWLATVVATWGSSPRPAGSLLACNADGQMTGSLSGGCVEDDLLEQLLEGKLAAQTPTLFEYGVTAEETERLGLPCGGHLSVFLEPLDPQHNSEVKQQISSIVEALEQRRSITRNVTTNNGQSTSTIAATTNYQPLVWDAEQQRLTQTFGPQQQLFIIGAGMVSQYLAEMAQMLDFEVTVCDPRQHLIDDFPNRSVRLICDMPDDAVARHASDAASAIVALTHDPRIDDMGLMQALGTEAFYIGAMGSSRTSASRRQRLQALDLSDAEIDRLHAPIGLPIGSKTPPEIAIAVLAEIIAVRKGVLTAQRTALEALVSSG